MKAKMKSGLALLLFLFQPLALMAEQNWTLADCTRYAAEHNLQIQQARHSTESAEVDVKQSREALFPSLTFNTQQGVNFQKVEGQNIGSFDTNAKNPTYNGSYGLQANVTLYNGGANWRQLEQSKISQQASQLEAEMTSNNIQVRIIEAYYQILYAHESVATNLEIVAAAERELERAKARQQVGKVSQVEVTQMQSQLEQNRYQLVQAKNSEAQNILSLKQLLQLSPDADFGVDYQSFGSDDVLKLIPSVTEVEEMAMNNLPNLRAAELQVKSSEMQVKIAKGGYLPTVSLNAGVSTNNGNALSGGFGTQVKNHLTSQIGLSVSVPIYDRRQTRSQVDKAKIQLANQELEAENTRLELQNTLSTLHLDIEAAQARYRSAVASEESARQTLEIMDERYGVGLESMLDLLTEKNNYLKARQETLQSKFTALLNLEILDFYTGNNK
ncbi:MAG: TolC family protein [Bacteroidales bacterium]|nr:TolC family protein [Bacteroidales bacterium]